MVEVNVVFVDLVTSSSCLPEHMKGLAGECLCLLAALVRVGGEYVAGEWRQDPGSCCFSLVVLVHVHAGVVNHDVFYGSGGEEVSSLVDINLQLYENLTVVAGSEGVQVLVFPEFGLEPVPAANRTDLYSIAETVPAVTDTLTTPCNEAKEFADRPILYRMSCAAKEASLLLLINMVDSQPCDTSTDSNCPEDGRYQVHCIH